MIERAQMVAGLARTAKEIPGVLNEWTSLDDDLAECYASQIEWLVGPGWEAAINGASDSELSALLDAGAPMIGYADRVRTVVGVDLRDFVQSHQRASERAI